MADFVAVLKKTLDGLADTNPQMREKVYEKARLTIASKLAAMNPPPPPAVIDKQKRALEEAIAQIEKEFAASKPKPSDPLAELEDVFASLKNPDPTAMLRDGARTRPVATPVAAAPAPAAPAKPAPAAARAPSAPAAAPLPAAASAAVAPKAAASPAQDTPKPVPEASAVDDLFTDVPEDEDAGRDFRRSTADMPRRKRGYGRLVLAAVIVAALAAGGYGAWMNWETVGGKVEQLLARFGVGAPPPAADQPAAAPAVEPEAPASDSAAASPDAEEEEGAPAEEAVAPVPEEPAPAPALQKFTQRLNADGTEIDAGPAGGAPIIGEGTSMAAVTEPPVAAMEPPVADAPPPAADEQPPEPAPADPVAAAADTAVPDDAAADVAAPATAEAPAEPADQAAAGSVDAVPVEPAAPAADADPAAPAEGQPAPDAAQPAPAAPAAPEAAPTAQAQAIPVGQRAIFYEERTNVAEASAEPGSIVWTLVQESPGGDLPPEPAIRAEATIPGKDVQLRMTIRRNADQSLPASHIIEMIFLTPQGFEGGGIDNVLRVSLKGSEQEAGSPLLGIPAKIADGFFLIALNDAKPDIEANTTLLGRQSWIDVPVQYKSGRRALFTMEKGIPGTKVFDEALKAWQAASSG